MAALVDGWNPLPGDVDDRTDTTLVLSTQQPDSGTTCWGNYTFVPRSSFSTRQGWNPLPGDVDDRTDTTLVLSTQQPDSGTTCWGGYTLGVIGYGVSTVFHGWG